MICVVSGYECLRCVQNTEYFNSLQIDSLQDASIVSDTVPSPVLEEQVEINEVNDVRRRRVEYFSSGPLHTITIKLHRMTLKEDLIREFAEKKVIYKIIIWRT